MAGVMFGGGIMLAACGLLLQIVLPVSSFPWRTFIISAVAIPAILAWIFLAIAAIIWLTGKS